MLNTKYIHTEDIEAKDGIYKIYDRVYDNVSYTINGSLYVFDVLDETKEPDAGKNDVYPRFVTAHGMDVYYGHRYSGMTVPKLMPTFVNNMMVDVQKVIWPDGTEHYNKELFFHFTLTCVNNPDHLAACYWAYGLGYNANISTAQYLYKDAILRAKYLYNWQSVNPIL